VYDCTDVNVKFQNFVETLLITMSQCIPARVVRLGRKDPLFITPLVRMLLNKRRALRRRGKFLEADILAEKINVIIRNNQSELLSNLTSQSTRKLWAAVNSKYRGCNSHIPKHVSAGCLNEFFAKISTGEHTNPEVYYSSAAKCDVEISDYQIETILRCVKRTSSGWDGLPSWLFKKCSVELASVVTHLINYSINVGQIPGIWRTAIVTPVPKVSQPAACSDYRPISVTPILSRITERIIVNRWLRPFIPPELLLN